MKKFIMAAATVAMIATAFTGCQKKSASASSDGKLKLELYYYKQVKLKVHLML